MSDNVVYVIADLHFGHKRVEDFRPFGSVKNHDDELIKRWNNTVNNNDTVWVLGDVAFPKEALHKVTYLKGIKKLVLGNHDNRPTQEYLALFNKVYGAVEMYGAILTHIPVHESELTRYNLNIHGHLHSKPLKDPRYICVSAEQVNYTPTPLYSLLGR
jgi:calcineurin-like phosphoesterase family protein